MELIPQAPGTQEIVLGAVSPTLSRDPSFFRTKAPGEGEGFASDVWAAAQASFQRENTMIALAQSMRVPTEENTPEQIERLRTINPFQIMIEDEDLGEEFMAEYGDAIEAGVFDFAIDKQDIINRSRQWSRQKLLVASMERSLIGSLAGGFGAAAVDPTSYIPIGGQLYRAGRMVKVARLVAQGAISATAAEVILQSAQDLRSIEESILNIGTAGAFAGGVGAFQIAALRNHPLHPKHPNNPLRPENLENDDVVIRQVGEEDVIVPGNTTRSTAGAAQVDNAIVAGPGGDIETAPAQSRSGQAVLNTVSAIQAAPGFGGMIGRAFARKSTLARRYAMRLMDNSGRLTRANLEGEATRASAENILHDHRRVAEALFSKREAIFRTLQKDMTLGLRRPFQTLKMDRDWQEWTRRLLRGIEEIDDKFEQAMIAKWGQRGSDMIKASAHKYAEEVQTANEYFRRQLVDQGFLRDNAKFAQLEKERAALRQQLKDAKAQTSGQELDDAGKAARDAQLDEIRKDIARADAAYEVERQRPEDLGREYGIAQVWDRAAISLYPEEFKSFLRSVLAKKPDESWLLENHQLTQSDLDGLRVTDPARHSEIIEEWAGDEWVTRVVRAESELEAARMIREDADNELAYTLSQLGLAKRDEVVTDLSVARKKRDQLAGELEARRKKRAQLRGEERALKEAATAARTSTLERQTQGREIRQFEQSLEPTRPQETPRLAQAEQRARDAAAELRRLDGEVKVAEERLQRLDAAMSRSQARSAEVKARKEYLKQETKLAKENSKLARTLEGKAERDFKKAMKDIPLEQTIDDIYTALASGREIPGGVLDQRMPQSGRLKQRQLLLTPEERMRAEQRLDNEGHTFLRTDLDDILDAQYQALSGHLAVRESLDGKSWDEVVSDITLEYDDLINEAKGVKEKHKLTAERDDAIKDLTTARDRILRIEDDGDSSGWMSWLSSKARLVTLARFGSGFGLSSFSDVGAYALRHPVSSIVKNMRQTRQVLSEAPESELAAIIHAAEIGGHSVMSKARITASRFGDDDVWDTGSPATSRTGRRVTGAIDHATRGLAATSIMAGGLRAWTRFMKASAAVSMTYRVRDLTAKYGSLSSNEIADLASVGIGKAEAAKIDAQMKKHGTSNSQGWFEPNLEEWTDPAAARVFRIALQRDMNRSVVTPGVGDTPRLMGHYAGRFFMQFWSHPMAFTNRYIIPAVQRGAMDPRVGVSLAVLLSSATAVTMAKEASRGEDPFKKFEDNPANFVAEVIDRSGLLGYVGPYAMASGRVMGLWESSRYERSSVISNFAGVNAGLIENLFDLGDTSVAALSGDKDLGDVHKKMSHLRPFDFLWDVQEALIE